MPKIDAQDRWLGSTIYQHYHAPITGFIGPNDPRSYGIEIEAEGVGPEGEARFADLAGKKVGWQCVHDGSLRDGAEFISAGPRAYDNLVTDLESLEAYLAKKKYTPVFSYRTSVHVHMNAMDLTMTQVFALFSLYTIFEAALIDFGGEERCGNVHCLPVSHAQGVLDTARNSCYNGDAGEVFARNGWQGYQRQLTSRDNRYASFNWASIADKGTVEFRSHRGTLDREEIMGWINVIDAMKTAVMGGFNNPIKVVEAFSVMGPAAFAEVIFGKANPEFVKFAANYHDKMWEGARLIQYVAFCRKEWPEPIKQKEPKTKKTQGRGIIVDEFGHIVEVGVQNGIQIIDEVHDEININRPRPLRAAQFGNPFLAGDRLEPNVWNMQWAEAAVPAPALRREEAAQRAAAFRRAVAAAQVPPQPAHRLEPDDF